MATFHTPLGKVRYYGKFRYIVVGRRNERLATKDGQTAITLKRSNSKQTAVTEAHRLSYGPETTLVVDTWNTWKRS